MIADGSAPTRPLVLSASLSRDSRMSKRMLGMPLDRAVRIVCHHIDREIARRAEHDIIGQMRIVAQIERGDQFAIA